MESTNEKPWKMSWPIRGKEIISSKRKMLVMIFLSSLKSNKFQILLAEEEKLLWQLPNRKTLLSINSKWNHLFFKIYNKNIVEYKSYEGRIEWNMNSASRSSYCALCVISETVQSIKIKSNQFALSNCNRVLDLDKVH